METSILTSIKKLIGLDADYTAFDEDIIIFINTALMTLQQYGVVGKEGFIITDASSTWSDALIADKNLEAAKQYVYLQVKMVFDPPSSSFVMDSYQRTCEMLEWRLKEQVESYPGDLPREEDNALENDLARYEELDRLDQHAMEENGGDG